MLATLPLLLSAALAVALPTAPTSSPRSLGPRAETWDTWCGAVQQYPGGKVQSAEASWVVPNISVPAGGNYQTDYWVYHWVGIDGSYGCQTGILQAGTSVDITQGYIRTQFWWEFWPDWPVFINDIELAPGHEVYVKVVASGTRSGTIYLENKTTGTQRSIPVNMNDPNGALCFSSAAFVAEDPHTSTQWWPLANFAGTTMANCGGTTWDGKTFGLNNANVGNMVQYGQTRCTAQLSSGNSVYIQG